MSLRVGRVSLGLVGAIVLAAAASRVVAQSTLERFRNAYSGTAPVVVEFRRAGALQGEVPAGIVETIKKIPGVSELQHPVTQQTIYDLIVGRVTYSGRLEVRLEERNRMQGGDPVRSTRVSLWNGEHMASVPYVGTETAQMRPVSAETAEIRREAHSRGMHPMSRERAESGFVALARYASEALGACGDLQVEAEGQGIVKLSSREIGLEARVDERTGELRSIREEMIDGTTVMWRWDGWLAGGLLPARHPRVQTVEYGEVNADTKAKTVRQGDVMYYDSIKPAQELTPDFFRWTSLSPLALNMVTKEVVRTDGSLNEVATAKQERQAAPARRATLAVDTDSKLTPVENTGIPKRYIAIGLVAIIAAVGVWLRKRAASL